VAEEVPLPQFTVSECEQCVFVKHNPPRYTILHRKRSWPWSQISGQSYASNVPCFVIAGTSQVPPVLTEVDPKASEPGCWTPFMGRNV
jgi:hypothetical protein